MWQSTSLNIEPAAKEFMKNLGYKPQPVTGLMENTREVCDIYSIDSRHVYRVLYNLLLAGYKAQVSPSYRSHHFAA